MGCKGSQVQILSPRLFLPGYPQSNFPYSGNHLNSGLFCVPKGLTNSRKSGTNSPSFHKIKRTPMYHQICNSGYCSPLVHRETWLETDRLEVARRVRQLTNPGCLGQMAQRYCSYCSERCPITALCVLTLMGEYLRRDHTISPSQESTESAEPLTIPPDELK